MTQPFRVLTLNTQNFIGITDEEDTRTEAFQYIANPFPETRKRIAQYIQSNRFDFIGLQEICGVSLRQFLRKHQLEFLADFAGYLNFEYESTKKYDPWWSPWPLIDQGIGIMTKEMYSSYVSEELPRTKGERRKFQSVMMHYAGRAIRVVNVHLEYDCVEDRKTQTDFLINRFITGYQGTMPTIIVGDFNWITSDDYQQFAVDGWQPVVPEKPTNCYWRKEVGLDANHHAQYNDAIILSPEWKLIEAHADYEAFLGDHAPFFVEVTL